MPDLPANGTYAVLCQQLSGETSTIGEVMAATKEEALLEAVEVVKAQGLPPDATIFVNDPRGDPAYEITVAELLR